MLCSLPTAATEDREKLEVYFDESQWHGQGEFVKYLASARLFDAWADSMKVSMLTYEESMLQLSSQLLHFLAL